MSDGVPSLVLQAAGGASGSCRPRQGGFLLNKVQFGFLYSRAFLPEGFLLLLKLTDENPIMKREKSLAVLVLRWPGVYVSLGL